MADAIEVLYFTDGFIRDSKTLTQLAILFDKVYTFWLSPNYFLTDLERRWEQQMNQPIFATAPITTKLYSPQYLSSFHTFLEDNSDLVDEKVLTPIIVNQTPPDWKGIDNSEKMMMADGSVLRFGALGQDVGFLPQIADTVYVDAPLFSLYRWQAISGGLHFALERGLIPITDDDTLGGLAHHTVSSLTDFAHIPTQEEIQASLSLHCLSYVVPNLKQLSSAEILEVRRVLKPELDAFRSVIKLVSAQIPSLSVIDAETIRRVVENRIQPSIDDLVLKIRSLQGQLWRKIARNLVVGLGVPLLCLPTGLSPLVAAVTSITALANSAFDAIEAVHEQSRILSAPQNRGLMFLIDVKHKYSR